MNTIDSMLTGDEKIVKRLTKQVGPFAASQFVSDFNNACRQMAGFEQLYQELTAEGTKFFAPVTNMSRLDN